MPRLYDNSRVSDHSMCPRFFYWRHIRDLEPATKNVNLVFGSAWHEAMDIVWQALSKMPELKDDEIAELGYDAFLKYWIDNGYPHPDNFTEEEEYTFRVKNPNAAYFMLMNYVPKRRRFIRDIELIEIEKPFAVPIDGYDKETFYVGRLDKVFKWNGRIWVAEHKTSSWGTIKNGLNGTYVDSFSPNTQIDGYMHAGHMEYGEAFKGIMVDAALCLNNCYEHFTWIPIERTIHNLDAWLWELKREIALLEINKKDLAEVSRTDDFMAAFPKRTKSCIQFMRPCMYIDMCKAIANPEETQGRELKGFRINHWSPFNEIDLEKIGITQEE